MAAGVDGYVDCVDEAHGVGPRGVGDDLSRPGAHVVDLLGRELIVLDQAARRTPL
ncbi:MAG: hypothetical protein IPL07_13010 [Acidimicrobiaceae bacterium]|nr:hypothetical protein [Acidimicrobiaceae bacterium]